MKIFQRYTFIAVILLVRERVVAQRDATRCNESQLQQSSYCTAFLEFMIPFRKDDFSVEKKKKENPFVQR